ncbi:D-lyxose/D-mannose family sugar isomerase [Salinarimonas chemoclinalis]|uniref:D-lyxose/D-mannose family sugar isomerase n=1 Tax=Salinarimonas chemoclinalis TaxID=3241599 RepID=UPI0035566C97
MKRSQINAVLREAQAFVRSFGFALPPFADWEPARFAAERERIAGILEAGLGWDVTDYGQGRFDAVGLVLFTLRNGTAADLARGRGMLYAEKLMIVGRDRLGPMHRHVVKAEDIIVRGARDGARLALRLHAPTPDGGIDRSSPVRVPCDGIVREVEAGGVVHLDVGESITLMPGIWHAFWGEGGDVLVGEVSTVNDDETDNVFEEPLPRFPTIDEDEAPFRLIVGDYARLRRRG